MIRSATSGLGSVFQFPSSFVPPSKMVSPCGNMYTIHGGSGSRLTRNSSMPGLAAITTWPRTGTTAGSGTRSWAAAPEQLTITGAAPASPASEVTGDTPSVPPARSNRVRRYSRWTGIVTSGAV